jgi:hypothetical protein
MNSKDFIIKYIKEIESLGKKSYDKSLNNSRGSINVFRAKQVCEILQDFLEFPQDDIHDDVLKIIQKFLKDLLFNLQWCIVDEITVDPNKLHGALQRSVGQCEGFLILLVNIFTDPLQKIENEKKQEELLAQAQKIKQYIEDQHKALNQGFEKEQNEFVKEKDEN